LEIRKGTTNDVSAIVPLWVGFMDFHAELDPMFTRLPEGVDNWTRYITEKLTDEDFAVFVAGEDGTLIGYTVVFLKEYPPIWTVKGCGFIDEMFVDPEHRGRGVGRKLYQSAEDWLRNKGAPHLELKVDLDNEPSRDFWARMGFEPRVEIRTKRFDPDE